jgi:branched-chain amino acid transport system substrate-binding protein
MRSWIAACAALVAVIALAGCGSGGGRAPTPEPSPTAAPASIVARAGDPVVVAVSAALSGDRTNLGADIADAVELAAADFGMVRGHPVTVLRKDDRCTDAEQAVAVAREFIAHGSVAGVIGPMCTTGAQAADALYEGAGIVHIQPSATRGDLSGQGERYFFRTSWRDDVQARTQAEHAFREIGARTAVLIDDGDPYGRTLADAFAAEYQALGGRIMTRERIKRGDVDFSALSREVAVAAPAIVVFQGLNPEGALILKRLREDLFPGAFIGPDALLSVRDFVQVAGPAAEQAIITGGPAPDEGFVSRFQERFQRAPSTPFVLQAYDAMTVLLLAIDEVADDDGGTLMVDRARLAEALRGITHQGLTGTIEFDERGDRRGDEPAAVGLRLYRVTEGRFEPIP